MRWIFRPFSFFKTRPHSGHLFGLSCDSSFFLLWSLGFGFSLFASFCGGILLLQSMSLYEVSSPPVTYERNVLEDLSAFL